jgi:hypothetical protein
MSDQEHFNYDFEREDHDFLSTIPEAPMQSSAWSSFSRPSEVLIEWHRTENQGPMGSCQGHSISSVLERLAMVRGEKVQLSEIFAYLATQKIDGLLGRDRGSTISGGCKVAMQYGCPPEKLTGYPRGYPSRSERVKILSEANYAAGEPYKAKSLWKVPKDHEAVLDFIGGGGGINFGIAYGSGTIPRDRVLDTFRPGRGGHAMAVLGYKSDGTLRAVNSHGDGEYFITKRGWEQIMNHRSTTAIGVMGNPEGEPVDWYKDSPYFQ